MSEDKVEQAIGEINKITRELKINDVPHVYLITMFKTYKHMIDFLDPSVIRHNLDEIEKGYVALMEELRDYAKERHTMEETIH